MGKLILVVLFVLTALMCACRAAKPLGGKFTGPEAIRQNLYLPENAEEEEMSKPTVECRALSLYKDATFSLRMKPNVKKPTNITVVVSIIKAKCANLGSCGVVGEEQYFGFWGNITAYTFYAEVDTKPEILIGRFQRVAYKPGEHGTSTEEEHKENTKNKREEGEGGNESKEKNTGDNKNAEQGAADDVKAKNDEGISSSNSSVTVSTPSQTPTPGAPPTTAPPTTDPTPGAPTTAPPTTAPPTTAPPTPASAKVDNPSGEFRTNESGLFIVYIQSWVREKGKHVNLTFDLEMKNTFGYLAAIDYPALVFYGLMLAVYIILGLAWSVCMCCSYKDLVRLQFWVFGVIILGFLEKVFFVSEYSSVNAGEQPSMLILLAEGISAVKRALARVLLIIVCLGFGTVIPRLGDSLMKVIAAGVIYWVLALIDGVVRSRTDTFDTDDRTPLVTMALLFFMDSFIFYWAMTALIGVRRALRLRKNYVKLAMYNHFAYTLIFSLLATLAFTIWLFVEVNFPKAGCMEDWQEVWLRDCFWHFLFVIVLIVIMIIWRPSANRNRFAYSLVNDLDQEDEEEEERMENKNFETVKMRSVSRGDAGTPPPISSTQAEDDLRWVEENLPTTAMDKALPLILDSDEEEMSTKFEVSKMN